MFFGAHVSSSGGIDKAVERAVAIGADAVQVFVQSPRMWRPVNHKDANVARFRELRAEHLQGAVAHAIYLINVASADEELWEKGAAALDNTMVQGARLGLDAVIFHPGSHKGATDQLDACIDRIATACLRAIEAGEAEAERSGTEPPDLLLENTAGAGGTIGRDVAELAAIVHAAGDHELLGVCLDSCHWWASGVDVTDRAVLDAKLGELDAAIGIERLRALHLNDSKTALGSNRDRHDNLGEGEIGEGLATFLGHPRVQHLGAYLEVPGGGDGPRSEDIEAARRLHELGLAQA